jgi:hypothetical protein
MMEERFARSGLAALLTGGETWIAVAYLVGMFVVVACHPQRIAKVSAFRRSYILFVLYLILPSAINALTMLSLWDGGRLSEASIAMVVFQLTSTGGKVLLGLSIASALESMVGRRPWGLPMPRDAEEPS